MDRVWKRLTKTCINWDEPCFVTEDLNDIAGNHKKKTGRNSVNMIENCGLIEFLTLGNTFSWSEQRGGQVIRCQFDWAFGN